MIFFCFSLRDNQSSVVEQISLIFLCVFEADLWLCPNGTSQSKLEQNDPYESNLRKNHQRCIDKIFIFSFWIDFLGFE
jgi:hypothetical protein